MWGRRTDDDGGGAGRALGLKRAALLEPAQTERGTGHVVGGISPLGQKRRLPTVVGSSLATVPRVVVSGGRRGLSVALSPQDLVRTVNGTFADLIEH